MAKQFFKNLPDTSTPLAATRFNGLLDGDESMGDLVVNNIRTKNMFDKNTVTYNSLYTQDGTIDTSGTYFSISDYIEVKPSTQYTYSGITVPGTAPYSVYLDSNKNFISSFKQQTGANTITTPSNAKYVRFSIAVTVRDIDTFQLEKGSVATAYSLYQNLDGKDTVIETTATINSSYISTIDANKVTKTGNVVQLVFRGYVNNSIPNNTSFISVPYSPVIGSANFFIAAIGTEYSYTDLLWGYITGDKKLRTNAVPSGKWIHINTIYITKD